MRGRLSRFAPVLAGYIALGALAVGSTARAPASQARTEVRRTVVVGGIQPCTGLPPSIVHDLPHYGAGTVVVLRGHVRWGRWRHGFRPLVFPRYVAAKETVRVNTTYRFSLLPGHYVLAAHLPRSTVRPFVQITVKREARIHADIPNMCI